MEEIPSEEEDHEENLMHLKDEEVADLNIASYHSSHEYKYAMNLP